MFDLRDYQVRMLDDARAAMRAGQRRVLLVAPTGAGKRIVGTWIISEALRRGLRCAFLVHRRELLDQTVATLDQAGIRHGVIQAGSRGDLDWSCQVASIPTLARRIATLPVFDLLVVDEFHHAASVTWSRLLGELPRAFVVGFTATPLRLDGKGLAKHADAMVVGPQTRWLIDQGHLADYVAYAPPGPDLAGIRTVAGDYHREDLAAAVDKLQIIGDTVAHYQRLAPSTQSICFAVTRLHSRHLADAFNAAGISARHVDGETPAEERRLALEDFRSGRFRALCSVDILGEGLDVEGIETVILCRPTRSLAVFLQQVGRGLRVKPSGRPCMILDHANNILRHGLPDTQREWILTADRERKPKPPSVRICPECFAALPAGTDPCPQCGHAWETARRRGTAHIDGDLARVDPSMVAVMNRSRLREQGGARTLEQLVALGRERGYRFPLSWARKIIKARRRA